MIIKKQIEKIVDKKIKKIQRAILSATKVRDSSPSAMESHSDTTKSEKENLIHAFEADIKKLNLLKDQLNNLKFYKIKLNSKDLKLCIVPEGLGGESVGEIKLVSSSSVIGKAICNKNVGDEIIFNNLHGKILDIK